MSENIRIGNVEGPFRPGKVYIDGSPRPAWVLRKQGTAKYWVVRYLQGTILKDQQFCSEASAKAFWESMPAAEMRDGPGGSYIAN